MSNGTLKLLAGLIAGLVAGVAIGIAVTSDDAKNRAGPTVAIEQTNDHRPPPKPETESAPPADHAPAPTPRTRTLGDIIAEADFPAIPSGNSEITGTVMTDEDEPLPGVKVTARSNYPESRRRSGMSAEERVQEEIRYAKWLEQSNHEATTGEDGTYRITGLAEGVEYFMNAELAGWNVQRKDDHKYRVAPPAEYHFVAGPEAEVEVTVRMPDGTAATDARLSYSSNLSSGSRGSTTNAGKQTLKLTPATWTIYATGGYRSEYRSETVEVTVVKGEPVEPLTLTLKESPGIKGRIEIPDGFEVPRIVVVVQSNPPEEAPGDFYSSRDYSTREHAAPVGDGLVFRVKDLSDGRYRVMLIDSMQILQWRDVVIAGNVIEWNPTLAAPNPTSAIPIRVLDPDGQPVRNASFSMTVRHESGSSSSGARPWKADDGTYWLMRRSGGRGEPHEVISFTIQVTAEPYASTSVEYDPAWTRVLEVRLSRGAHVELTVPNFNDHEHRDRLIWQVQKAVDEGTRRYGPTFWRHRRERQESPMKFGPFEPGEHEIVLAVGLNEHHSVVVLTRRVRLEEGENSFTESVPVLHRLVILAPEGTDRLNVEVEALDGDFSARSHMMETKDGRATIDCIPPGRYRLKDRNGEMVIQVPGREEVVFEPRKYDCFELKLVPNGRIEALGLRNGDKVIEIDGKEIEDVETGRMLLMAAFSNESTAWVVLRNGLRTVVTFDGTTLFEITRKGENQELFRPQPALRD